MEKEQELLQKQKLAKVSLREWRDALNKLSRHITWRLKAQIIENENETPEVVGGLTAHGAHSEHHLGENALNYYTKEAILKLYECRWEWQERFTLSQQLIRIVDRLIENEHDKYVEVVVRTPEETNPKYMEALQEFGQEMQRHTTQVDKDYQRICAAVKGDAELEAFVDAISDCAPHALDDGASGRIMPLVCERMGITPQQAYNLNKRLKRKMNH